MVPIAAPPIITSSAGCISALSTRRLVRNTRDRSQQTHEQKIQKVPVKSEPNRRPSTEHRQKCSHPASERPSSVILLSHLDPASNQDGAACKKPHAHKYPSQINDLCQISGNTGICNFSMNDAKTGRVQQSA